MRIIEREDVAYQKIVEYDYTPSFEELYWYYSGTSGGLNRNNPYSLKRGRVTRIRYKKLTPPDNQLNKEEE